MIKKLKKIINIFQWLLTIVLISVVLLLVFTAFNPIKNFQILRVMSGSMEPKIKVGSIVFVQKVKPEILKENDVITYASLEDSSILITHRLTAIEEKEGRTVFKTQGDANSSKDIAEVSPSQIKGKVIFSLPFLGYLSVWIRKPLGFGLLVILPALLIIISEILNIKKTIEKEVEKKYAKLEKRKKSPPANLLFIFFLIGVGFSQIKSTNAFFSDVMLVEGNTFTAARLDFSLNSPANFFPDTLTPGDSSTRDVGVVNDGSLDFQYNLSATQTGGDSNFCGALQIEARLNETVQYSGSLLGLTATMVFNPLDNWEFYVSLNDYDLSLQSKICNFDLVFSGEQVGGGGFTDEEILENTIYSGTWMPSPGSGDVVISEVYYDVALDKGNEDNSANPDEWVELYNNSVSPVNLKNWKIGDNSGSDTIIHANVYIPAKGFAVLAKSASTWTYWSIPTEATKIQLGQKIGNGLDDDSDRVVLKDSNGTEIDAVSWGTDISAFSPSVSDVPEGHSISRIVKGVDTNIAANWIDTPGGPNPGTNPHPPEWEEPGEEDENKIAGEPEGLVGEETLTSEAEENEDEIKTPEEEVNEGSEVEEQIQKTEPESKVEEEPEEETGEGQEKEVPPVEQSPASRCGIPGKNSSRNFGGRNSGGA
jgi:signal peptidase